MLIFVAETKYMSIKDKFLITGFSGFVSKHFIDFLENNKISAEVLGVDVNDEIPFDYSNYKSVTCNFKKIDLLNKVSVENVIQKFQPNYVLHLASYSSVAMSWKMPVESFTNNTNIFLNLIETIRLSGINCRILSIGSSEEYGNVLDGNVHLTEEHVLNPISPYAVARVSQEMLSKVYTDSYGMDIIMTRSFNHIGTHQKDIFVIPSFVKKMIALKSTADKVKELTTGDTSIIRDFVDVRAVVEAYYLLFKKGKKGEIYNICNEKGTSLNEVIQIISSILNIKVVQKIDPKLVRPNDNKIIIGSNQKIKKDTGWANKYSLEDSLKDIVAYYQEN
ncbi:MAG: GDP-mannose 4,6-dehydratase [Bacteroidetes bacterium]|nr:GDP-mannose 4,6-dehydratase [Bacteroidota bacterium]